MKKIQVGGHQKNSKKYYALVDDSDYEWLNKFKWSIDSHGYACYQDKTGKKIVSVYMARKIMEEPAGRLVDHMDGNKLNNQRFNLRMCTVAENIRNTPKTKNNTSGFKGVTVSLYKGAKRFRTRIMLDRKSLHIGYFGTAEKASKAYNEAALKYHKEFANINKI